MSHQSGIIVSEDLKRLFLERRSECSIRIIKICIEGELANSKDVFCGTPDWKNDIECIQKFLEDQRPCFILFCAESPLSKPLWWLLSYIPEEAQVREKMIYAASRHSLKKQLGQADIVLEYFGTNKTDFSSILLLEKFQTNQEEPNDNTPYKKNDLVFHSSTMAQLSGHIHGTKLPLSSELADTLKVFATEEKSVKSVLILGIDLKRECFVLVSRSIDIKSAAFSATNPCYMLFKYNESPDIGGTSEIVFIYFCPTESSVKERMMYSSSKGSILTYIKDEFSILIGKAIETDDANEMTDVYIRDKLLSRDEIAPSNKFAKPRPMNGNRRLQSSEQQ